MLLKTTITYTFTMTYITLGQKIRSDPLTITEDIQ